MLSPLVVFCPASSSPGHSSLIRFISREPAPEVPPGAATREGTAATPTRTPDPSSSSFGTGVRRRLAARVRRPGSRSFSLSLSTLATPEPRRPLGVRPGLGPSSTRGTQGHLSQPSWAGRALYILLEGWE